MTVPLTGPRKGWLVATTVEAGSLVIACNSIVVKVEEERQGWWGEVCRPYRLGV